VYCIDKAQRVLDFIASTSLATGIEKTVVWYRESGYLPA
jgi:nucleoside-diphosphate-sugar epimerase